MIADPLGDDLVDRVARCLRTEPPSFLEPRSDLKGDHALDPASWPLLPSASPRTAAVLVPLVGREGGTTVLLTERSSHLRSHSGQIAFPGGRMDPEDVSPVETALREAEEEIGLSRRHVRPLGYLDAYLSSSNYFVLPVVAAVAPALKLRINPEEVADAFEVPLAFLMDEANHEMHAREWQGRVRPYYAMPFGDRYIWGLTAGILRNMYEKLHTSC